MSARRPGRTIASNWAVTPPEHRPPPRPIPAGELTPTARPWMERGARQCAWPITVRGETWSCCAPATRVYCPGHAAIAFTGRTVAAAIAADLKKVKTA